MQYRELGKTGKQVSVIGLGCEHLDGADYDTVKSVLDTAIEGGVNILDVFMPGKDVRENIAKALGARRKDVMIQGHIGSTDVNQQYDISRDMPVVKRYFEDMLRIYGGYIDFGMMFFIDSDKDYQGVFETGFIEYVQFLKKEGYIGHIGFSSHNPETAMKVIRTGVPEMLMFSINPAFDMLPSEAYALSQLETGFQKELFQGINPKRAELYKLCEKEQVGITVMKTLGGGKLVSPEHTPFEKPMTVPQCVHYALSRPAVASVLLGSRSAKEAKQALSYLSSSEQEKDYSGVLGTLRNDFKGNCVYCGHCQPCPAEIDIAAVNKYLDIARLQPDAVPPSIRSHYNSLGHSGADCIACGSCEEKCPFGVPVIENMAQAARLFE